MHRYMIIALMLLECFFASKNVYAGTTVTQALNFGEWAVYNNDSAYEVTISTDGSYSYNASGFIMISPPEKGIFIIDSLTANAAVQSVSISQTSPMMYIGNSFQMNTFQKAHASTVASDGTLTITVGGTAISSGTTASYPDGMYSGTLFIEIDI